MKRTLLMLNLAICGFLFGQENCQNLNNEISNLKTEINSLNSENIYLKKVLNINKSILENEIDNTSFRITKVVGNKTEKTISISFLVETKNENKKMSIQDIYIIDIEGNQYKIDFYKSSKPYPELSLNVPMKLTFSFKEIENEPLFLKLFKFNTESSLERNLFEKTRSIVEFKDLKIIWN